MKKGQEGKGGAGLGRGGQGGTWQSRGVRTGEGDMGNLSKEYEDVLPMTAVTCIILVY